MTGGATMQDRYTALHEATTDDLVDELIRRFPAVLVVFANRVDGSLSIRATGGGVDARILAIRAHAFLSSNGGA